MTTNKPMRYLINARAKAESSGDPNARYCTLATVEKSEPTQARMRTLVARDITEDYCLLFVNKHSQKNIVDLQTTNTEILFFYPTLMMQFRLRGSLSLLPAKVLASHWQHKPYESKLLDHFYATKQPQSSPVKERSVIDEEIEQLKHRYPNPQAVPFAEDAIGVMVAAHYLEVWQGQDNGIHDRRLYRLHEHVWHCETLVP